MRVFLLCFLLIPIVSYSQIKPGNWIFGIDAIYNRSNEELNEDQTNVVINKLNQISVIFDFGHQINNHMNPFIRIGYIYDDRTVEDKFPFGTNSSVFDLVENYKVEQLVFGFGFNHLFPVGKSGVLFVATLKAEFATGNGAGIVNYREYKWGQQFDINVMSEGERSNLFVGGNLGVWFIPFEHLGFKCSYGEIGYKASNENVRYQGGQDYAKKYNGIMVNLKPETLRFGVLFYF